MATSTIEPEIRPLAPSEIPSLTALWAAAGLTRPWNDAEADARIALTSPSSTILAGFADGKLAASVMVGFDGHRAVVYYLAVGPDHRRRGYGAAMMKAAEAWARARGAPKLNLVVRAENDQVRSFYEALGYAFEERLNFGRRL
jgi:ribosomal protein S18 acetylase RimI-like enzyme